MTDEIYKHLIIYFIEIIMTDNINCGRHCAEAQKLATRFANFENNVKPLRHFTHTNIWLDDRVSLLVGGKKFSQLLALP